MDWLEDIGSNMWLLPRGIFRDGGTDNNSLKWTSNYGSVIMTAYDIGTADGLNEKGLTANLLYLTESDFGVRDEKLPGLSVSLWAQYYLDNFETVAEQWRPLKPNLIKYNLFQLKLLREREQDPWHLAISDKTGDTAVIEYIDGKPKVYHDKNFKVMTNSPPYNEQLTALKQYKGFGGQKDLPDTNAAADRFVRAAFYAQQLPQPAEYRESVAGVLSVLRNVSQPFGTPDPARPYVSTTRWRTVADMTRGVYFYENTLAPNLVWVQLDRLEFKKNAPVQKITLVKNYDLVGDISGYFKPVKAFEFLKKAPEKPVSQK
ncbi:linear amide C-N hydrolase [Bdellovibrio sp. HCB185ZH]|uniref:linear amide C-N hydrolase n=1 Tax=Bdellovibrio sp. HCB185ZH TaxID=3394235 RepID=UPI0039A47E36